MSYNHKINQLMNFFFRFMYEWNCVEKRAQYSTREHKTKSVLRHRIHHLYYMRTVWFNESFNVVHLILTFYIDFWLATAKRRHHHLHTCSDTFQLKSISRTVFMCINSSGMDSKYIHQCVLCMDALIRHSLLLSTLVDCQKARYLRPLRHK